MPHYVAYGHYIKSDLVLPELTKTDEMSDNPDIVIRLENKAGYSNSQIYNEPPLIMDTEAGRFFMHAGREVVVDQVPETDLAMVRMFLLGPVLAVVLRQRGMLVLHASATVVNNSVVAFLGSSGWGKSTIVEAFYKRGYPLVTDDILAIQLMNNSPMVQPGYPQVKLWPEAAKSLGYSKGALEKLHSQSPKFVHRPADGFLQRPLPLGCIYVLLGTASHRHSISALQSKQAFVELVSHSRGVLIPRNRTLESLHFQQCVGLMKTIPIRRLNRRRSLNALPELVDLITQDLARLSSPFIVADH